MSATAATAASASCTVVTHPLVQAKLARLRDAATSPDRFRPLLREVAALLFFAATADLESVPTTVQTPLAPCPSSAPARPLVLAPILRAGLGLLEGIHPLVPEAAVAHVGIYRDEASLAPMQYYERTPPHLAASDVLILDPMLATGGSATAAATRMKTHGATRMRFLCLVSCPEGIARLGDAHPDVPVFTAAVDERLNAVGYIVPGLGDAGDRYFGT